MEWDSKKSSESYGQNYRFDMHRRWYSSFSLLDSYINKDEKFLPRMIPLQGVNKLYEFDIKNSEFISPDCFKISTNVYKKMKKFSNFQFMSAKKPNTKKTFIFNLFMNHWPNLNLTPSIQLFVQQASNAKQDWYLLCLCESFCYPGEDGENRQYLLIYCPANSLKMDDSIRVHSWEACYCHDENKFRIKFLPFLHTCFDSPIIHCTIRDAVSQNINITHILSSPHYDADFRNSINFLTRFLIQNIINIIIQYNLLLA